MISVLKPAPVAPPIDSARVDREYRRLRWQVFGGIFFGYAAFYLVRNNFALAIPDVLKTHPEYSKAQLGSVMTGLSLAYGISKFIMGSVSDRSNPRWFMPLGLLLTCAITFAFGVWRRGGAEARDRAVLLTGIALLWLGLATFGDRMKRS